MFKLDQISNDLQNQFDKLKSEKFIRHNHLIFDAIHDLHTQINILIQEIENASQTCKIGLDDLHIQIAQLNSNELMQLNEKIINSNNKINKLVLKRQYISLKLDRYETLINSLNKELVKYKDKYENVKRLLYDTTNSSLNCDSLLLDEFSFDFDKLIYLK